MICHWSASTGDVLSLVYPEGLTRTHSPAKVSNIQSKIWERKKNFDLYGIKIMIINHIHYLGCMTIDVRYVAGSNPSEIIWCYVMWKRTSYTLPSSIMLTMGTGVRWKLPWDGGRGGGWTDFMRLHSPEKDVTFDFIFINYQIYDQKLNFRETLG